MSTRFAAVFLALIAPAAAFAQTLGTPPPAQPFTAEKARAINAIAREEVHSGSTPGLAVGIVEDGLLVYSHGFGYANLSTHRRAGAATEFYAGSIAKEFTAAAVLLLAADKKLSLTDRVRQYVPELTVAGSATVAELLYQTSGLPDYTHAPGIGHDTTRPVKLAALIAAVDRMKPASAPGAAFAYNDFNYMIAGLIVSRVSGVPLSVFMQTRIFQPLIMTSTFLAGDQGISPDLAVGYTRAAGHFVRAKRMNPSWLYGAAGLITTVNDLAKWDVGMPLILDVDSVRTMWTPGVSGGPAQYGMGWVIDQRGGRRFFWHNGEVAGYHAMNALLPDQHIAVIVLSNADALGSGTTVAPERLASRILDIVAPLPPSHFANPIVERATEWIDRLQHDDVDRTQLTPQFSAFLTDALVTKANLASLGTVSSMVPIESFVRDGLSVYVFEVKFRRGTMRYEFTLSPDGKIAGILLTPISGVER